jgi:hypothetical protein
LGGLAGCAQAKPIARTVNDAARIACEVAFGEEALPQGVTLEDLCAAQEDLQPFIRNILAAKQVVGAAHGLKPQEE